MMILPMLLISFLFTACIIQLLLVWHEQYQKCYDDFLKKSNSEYIQHCRTVSNLNLEIQELKAKLKIYEN